MKNISMIDRHLNSMTPSDKLKMYGQLLLRAQRYALNRKFSYADAIHKDADKILLHFEKTLDLESIIGSAK